MAKKEVLRKIVNLFSLLFFVYITVAFFFGKTTIFQSVLLIILYCLLALYLVIRLVLKLVSLIIGFVTYKQYKESYEDFKKFHKQRYKLYFTGTREQVEESSKDLHDFGNTLVHVGEKYVSNSFFTKTQIQNIQEMLANIQELLKD